MVKVKPLEWEQLRSCHVAEGAAGIQYETYEVRPNQWNCTSPAPFCERLASGVSLDAAKAAAQADYEARILSALATPAPDDETREGAVEAFSAIQPKLMDEPAAYKRACFRAGYDAALRAIAERVGS